MAALAIAAPLDPTGWQFPSRSGGKGHSVSLRVAQDGSKYLTCSCPGGQFAFATTDPAKRGKGCWAMKAVVAAGALR